MTEEEPPYRRIAGSPIHKLGELFIHYANWCVQILRQKIGDEAFFDIDPGTVSGYVLDHYHQDREISGRLRRWNTNYLIPLRTHTLFHPGSTMQFMMDGGETRKKILGLYDELHNPSWMEMQSYYTDLFFDLANNEDPYYEGLERKIAINTVAGILSHTGLAFSNDIMHTLYGQDRFKIPRTSPVGKYMSYESVMKLTQEGGVTGLFHGSFDAPHSGHMGMIPELYRYSERVVIGFSNDDLLRLKATENDPRPLHPLEWRMWEMASHPMVDAVFVVPIRPSSHIDEEFMRMYEELNVTRLISGRNNPLLPNYQNRMRQLGGRVIIHNEGFVSSTLREEQIRERLRASQWYINRMAAVARSCGFMYANP